MTTLMTKMVQQAVKEATDRPQWPDQFINKDTRRVYKPHHESEAAWVYADEPRYMLARGGEGSGKSVALIMKIFHKLRRGMSGIVVSPSLPSFKRSLFPELLRWLPKEVVVSEHQRYFSPTWRPHTGFDIVVKNELGTYSVLTCASAENPIFLEGPNLNFAALDEIRGMPTAGPLIVLAGRIRVMGPNGEPPQLFCSSTPRSHWMMEFFGPEKPEDEIDEYREFKRQSYAITLRTEDNVKAGNIDINYIGGRGAALTEAQKRVLLSGEWGEEENPEAFFEDITIWDALTVEIPPLRKKHQTGRDWSDALVVALDAATNRDSFSLIGITRDPRNRNNLAVRIVKVWEPKNGKIDFQGTPDNMGPELYLKWLCKNYVVSTVVYDPYQLYDMCNRLRKEGIAWFQPFDQGARRSLADQQFYDLVLNGRFAHDGNNVLRQHAKNADRKFDYELHKNRLVKRYEKLRIDAVVSASMASHECLRLNL